MFVLLREFDVAISKKKSFYNIYETSLVGAHLNVPIFLSDQPKPQTALHLVRLELGADQ